MPASTYAANAILNHFLRGVAAASPARLYVSLHTADPGNAGASEVATAAWPAYTRLSVAAGTALVRRITALSSTKITINGEAFLSWRYLRRATPNRIMRVQPMRPLVVAPELRRFIVPRDMSVMRLPRDRGVMP